METTLAIVVLILILLVLAGLVYAYVRSSGPGAIRALFIAPATLRQTFGSMLVSARDTTGRRGSGTSEEIAPGRSERALAGSVTLAYDETALATMRSELESALHQTRERQHELAERLQRLDVAVSEMRSVPDELTGMMRLRERRTRRHLAQLRYELEGVRRNGTAAGARRDEAYAELYGYLAQIEASLATVINPMQLPGEPLQVPDEFVPETLEWDNWDDVGEHAYAFGMAFNRSRMVLEPALAQEIELFLTTLRQALTGKVYPTVRRGDPTRAQLALMRTGLESIVEAVGPIRRRLEAAWHQMDRPTLDHGDDEDAEPEAIDPDDADASGDGDG
jgi:hypothetical protein